jgi:hypothetical protein
MNTLKFFSLFFSLFCLLLFSTGCDIECDPSLENCDTLISPDCETNNDFDCAKKISIGQTIQDKIDIEGEQDFFVFEITEVGILELKIDAVPTGISMYVDVYNTNNENSRLKTDNADSGESITFDVGPLSIGKHYIKVRSWSNRISDEKYSLTINLDLNDANEFNNNFNQAKSIDFGVSTQATIRSHGDVDYFKFNNTTTGVLEVNIPEVPDGIYMYVRVYDTNNDNSLLKLAEGDSGESIVFDVGPFGIGEHFIEIRAWSNGSSADTYNLIINWDTSDENEVNNSFSQATSINLSEIKKGTIRSSYDVDFYKVTTTQAGVLKVSIPEVPDGIYMYAAIYATNNDNSSVGSGQGDSGQNLTLQSNTMLEPGTHYVKLWAWSNGSSPDTYELTINQ